MQRYNERVNSAHGAGAQVKEKGKEGRTDSLEAAEFESAQINCKESDSLGPQEEVEAKRLLLLSRVGPCISLYTHHAE